MNAALDPPLGIQNFATSGNCHILKTSQVASDPTCQPTSAAGSLPASSTGLGIQALQKGDNRTPWVQNWTFLIDQRAPWNSLFEIGYVGSHTSDMLIAANLSNINYVPIGGYFQPNPVTGITYYCQGPASPTCSSSGPPNTSQYLPWNYSSIQVASHGSYSNYNALQMMWQKQTGRSTFMVNYTFSKVLGIRDGQHNGNGNGTVLDVFNMKNNYGVLAYDHTNIFNAAYVLSIPGVHTSNKFASGAVNGWQLSGTLQYQSGAPIQPNAGGTLNVNYQNGESPSSILNQRPRSCSSIDVRPAAEDDGRPVFQSRLLRDAYARRAGQHHLAVHQGPGVFQHRPVTLQELPRDGTADAAIPHPGVQLHQP